MAAAHLFRSVQASPASATAIPSVLVCEAGTQTPLAQTMYAEEGLVHVITNPVAITNGVLDIYLPNTQDVCLVVTYGSAKRVIDYQSALFPAPLILSTPSGGTAGQIVALDNTGKLAWGTSSATTAVDNGNGTATLSGGTSVDNGNGTATFGP